MTTSKLQSKTKTLRPTPAPKHLNPDDIPRSLESLFPSETVDKIACETGFTKRHRKIEPYLFLWNLILGFGVQLQRTLESLRKGYCDMAGLDICQSAWHDRFNVESVTFLRSCVELALQQMAKETNRTLSAKMNWVDDILIQDSSIVRLSAALMKQFPAVRSRGNAAGLKVSLLVSAVASSPQKVTIHGERISEIKTLKIGPWVKNKLLLIDLGFFKYQMFARIQENGGYFLTRLKNNSNPLFLSTLRTYRGNAIELEGKRWKDVKEKMKRSILDAEIEISFSRRAYKGKRSKDTKSFRLVAIYNAEAKKYHTYLTNIPPEVLSAEDVAELYRVRWDIELIFKELKSKYSLDVITSANPNVVEGLIWVGILTLLVSRRLFNLLRASAPLERAVRYTPLRWATTFVKNATLLEISLLGYFGFEEPYKKGFKKLAWIYERHSFDPNGKRHRLPEGWYS
jgi:putative transposase